MKKLLYIQCDYNDADYVSDLVEVTDQELKDLEPAIKLINDNPSCVSEWVERDFSIDDNENDMASAEEKAIETMLCIFPCPPEGMTIHTVNIMKVLTVTEERDL